MLSKHDSNQRNQLVPVNHLVRNIEAAIDFSMYTMNTLIVNYSLRAGY